MSGDFPEDLLVRCDWAKTELCYAFMQAVGMVNDHLVPCFRHRAVIATGC